MHTHTLPNLPFQRPLPKPGDLYEIELLLAQCFREEVIYLKLWTDDK